MSQIGWGDDRFGPGSGQLFYTGEGVSTGGPLVRSPPAGVVGGTTEAVVFSYVWEGSGGFSSSDPLWVSGVGSIAPIGRSYIESFVFSGFYEYSVGVLRVSAVIGGVPAENTLVYVTSGFSDGYARQSWSSENTGDPRPKKYLGWGTNAPSGTLDEIWSLPSRVPLGPLFSLNSGSRYLAAYSSGAESQLGVAGDYAPHVLNFAWTPTAFGATVESGTSQSDYLGVTTVVEFFNSSSTAGLTSGEDVELGTMVITGTIDGVPAGNSLNLTVYGVFFPGDTEFLGPYGIYRVDWGYTLLGAQLFWTSKVGTQET